jgi:DNA invertase Pin-like site-specific DNA recombinase
MTLTAITYARWSRHEQGRGTTATRQHELTTDFCARQGWAVAEHVTDDGISAWTGDNIKTGNLARLIERLEREGGAGKVLVVEKLDRLSRQPPLVMTNWLQRALATGLTIATVDGRHDITTHTLMSQPIVLMSVIFESFRGYDESQAKSDRVAEAWAKKRERGAPMSRLCPAWLDIAEDATNYRSATNLSAQYQVIEERAAIVRRIFDLTEAGVGKATIAARLNAERVSVFGRGDGWHASYVQKILRNAAVIGEYQPHTKPRGGVRKPVGEPIRDYFPAVITVEQYDRVNDRRQVAVLAQQSGYIGSATCSPVWRGARPVAGP